MKQFLASVLVLSTFSLGSRRVRRQGDRHERDESLYAGWNNDGYRRKRSQADRRQSSARAAVDASHGSKLNRRHEAAVRLHGPD